ncbi:AraC-type DNA-binding protein [Cohaesibacter gelatinilyticus]|uniref:AraC-type DNA-binding protein n=1 Tax=Cohaesibacter gelatinilyticus TaxID=372072 RepID=A0A285PGR0_9HYPH|nr:AraC-type DNA-binding protein [Cohaesibacter gelatinilyticus]
MIVASSDELKAQDIAPGLERSCKRDWVEAAPYQPGIHRIEAFFSGDAYAPHRHDTYSIGYTIHGIQSFSYRGARTASTAGRVMVLHPDEVHDGGAGSDEGFHYKMLYIDPSLIRAALGDGASTLPFVKEAILTDPRLFHAIQTAFADMAIELEPTALDEIAVLLADGLLANDQSVKRSSGSLIDLKAIKRAKDYLEANLERPVTSDELETVSGQDRFSLARQFRKALGTSPYRYQMLRRLDLARAEIQKGNSLVNASIMAGFSDQPHMSRHFKSTFGISPGQWQRLTTNV